MSKTIYLGGRERRVDSLRIPTDLEKTGFCSFVPADSVSPSSLPAWMSCACTQAFTPSSDVNDELTFTLSGMTEKPDLVLVVCDSVKGRANYDYGGGVYFCNMAGMSSPLSTFYQGYNYMRTANTSQGYLVSPVADGYGVVESEADHVKLRTPKYGQTSCYWRAGVTYTVTAVKLRLLT